MKSITIKGSERESVGKVATKALRNAGLVPCVLYGGNQAVHFSAEIMAFRNLVYTPNAHTVVRFYILTSFNYLMTKKSLWKFLLNLLEHQKVF
jgi:ribosomal protein L25 (general stress protein Ctc)